MVQPLARAVCRQVSASQSSELHPDPIYSIIGKSKHDTATPLMPSPRATALTSIAEFEANMERGAFVNIREQDIARGLRQRLATPGTVRQGTASLCGPSVLMYWLIRKKPDVYVRYVLDLYRTGQGSIGRLTVRPGADCRRYAVRRIPARGRIPAHWEIPPVDWVACASLRDSENDFFDYDSPSVETGGITMPEDLRDWFRKAGFGTTRNDTNTFFTKGQSELERASSLFLQNHCVCLFINANMLDEDSHTSGSMTPNHWVGLTSGVTSSGDRSSFTVFSWGNGAHRVPPVGSLAVGDVVDNFYGYVSAI